LLAGAIDIGARLSVFTRKVILFSGAVLKRSKVCSVLCTGFVYEFRESRIRIAKQLLGGGVLCHLAIIHHKDSRDFILAVERKEGKHV